MQLDKLERIKALKEYLNDDTTNDDELRAYAIQLETLLPATDKTLYVDADGLIYKAALSPMFITTIKPIEGGTFIGTPVDDEGFSDSDYIDLFETIVEGVVFACKIQSLLGNMVRFSNYKLVFTPRKNFRYDIFPDYKIKRADREKSYAEVLLKDYVKSNKDNIFVEGVEADDVVAYYIRRGHPAASGDKDVVFGVPSFGTYHFHHSHMKPYKTSVEEANRFLMIQCLMGDSADDIPGIKCVGIKTAEKLLSCTYTFEKVILIYKDCFKCNSCGNAFHMNKLKDLECDGDFFGTCPDCKTTKTFFNLDEDDATLTRRLVGLDQWKGFTRNKVILFEYNR